jgi:hypothetical protein
MATPRTGRPRGRPKGSQSKKTIESAEKALAVLATAVPDGTDRFFGGDAHAFLVSVYRDNQQDMGYRIKAATKAISFEKPALAAMTLRAEGKDNTIEQARRRELLDGLQELKEKMRLMGESAKAIEAAGSWSPPAEEAS